MQFGSPEAENEGGLQQKNKCGHLLPSPEIEVDRQEWDLNLT